MPLFGFEDDDFGAVSLDINGLLLAVYFYFSFGVGWWIAPPCLSHLVKLFRYNQ